MLKLAHEVVWSLLPSKICGNKPGGFRKSAVSNNGFHHDFSVSSLATLTYKTLLEGT